MVEPVVQAVVEEQELPAMEMAPLEQSDKGMPVAMVKLTQLTVAAVVAVVLVLPDKTLLLRQQEMVVTVFRIALPDLQFTTLVAVVVVLVVQLIRELAALGEAVMALMEALLEMEMQILAVAVAVMVIILILPVLVVLVL